MGALPGKRPAKLVTVRVLLLFELGKVNCFAASISPGLALGVDTEENFAFSASAGMLEAMVEMEPMEDERLSLLECEKMEQDALDPTLVVLLLEEGLAKGSDEEANDAADEEEEEDTRLSLV